MRKIIAVAFLILSTSSSTAFDLNSSLSIPNFNHKWNKNELIILDHHGGNLDRELRNIERARKRKYPVVLEGWIKSSGTLWLSLPKSQFCIKPEAIFLFHQGSNGREPASIEEQNRYWRRLPARVRNYIVQQKVENWKKPDPRTNLPWIDWIRVSGSEAVRAGFGRACGMT